MSDPDAALQAARREVQGLVEALEATLDARERRLLHQLRLAAEALGAARAGALYPPRPG